MSKVTSKIDGIIRSNGWAKAFSEYDNVMKYKKVTGVDWVNDNILNDADNEQKLLWMISAGTTRNADSNPDEPIRPDVVINTPEQDAIQNNVEEQIAAGTRVITIPEGQTANNLTIPASATGTITITGNIQDGATITNLSSKGITVNNTGSEGTPNIIIDSLDGNVTLKGQYNQVWANTKSISASRAKIQDVVFGGELEGNGDLSVGADWSDPVTVTSYNTNNLAIRNNSDTTVMEQINIVAPNATVDLYGKWGDVYATVGDDTLILDANFHAAKLVISKGNVLVHNCYPNECADIIEVPTGGTISAYTYNVDTTGSLVKLAGIYEINGEVTADGVFGIIGAGNFMYVNNGKVIAKNKNGFLMVRPAINITIEGDGEWENQQGYGIWKSNNDGVIKVMSGKFKAQTHVVYAEHGFIEIHGGEFELINTEDKKFLLNCLDASYKAGTAGITVYGGKFHNFDPANSMSESETPVSFVAEGYKSVRTAENVWEVYPKDVEVDAYETPATPDEVVVEDTTTDDENKSVSNY